jgi:hypothetical protein
VQHYQCSEIPVELAVIVFCFQFIGVEMAICGFLSPLRGTSPQVADWGVGLQICMLAENILNRQLWTADQGGLA